MNDWPNATNLRQWQIRNVIAWHDAQRVQVDTAALYIKRITWEERAELIKAARKEMAKREAKAEAKRQARRDDAKREAKRQAKRDMR